MLSIKLGTLCSTTVAGILAHCHSGCFFDEGYRVATGDDLAFDIGDSDVDLVVAVFEVFVEGVVPVALTVSLDRDDNREAIDVEGCKTIGQCLASEGDLACSLSTVRFCFDLGNLDLGHDKVLGVEGALLLLSDDTLEPASWRKNSARLRAEFGFFFGGFPCGFWAKFR